MIKKKNVYEVDTEESCESVLSKFDFSAIDNNDDFIYSDIIKDNIMTYIAGYCFHKI